MAVVLERTNGAMSAGCTISAVALLLLLGLLTFAALRHFLVAPIFRGVAGTRLIVFKR